jgi:iron complex outermembrane receptor protein
MSSSRLSLLLAVVLVSISTPAVAQRAAENAVTNATDGFGTTVGNERVGVYSTRNVRGFNPITAGNRRLDGLYFDLGGNGLTNRLYRRATVRVGLPALAYPFPAPSGIVDYALRGAGTDAVLSAVVSLPEYGGGTIELDGSVPLVADRLVVAGGLGFASSLHVDGRWDETASAAILPTLQLRNGELTPFLGYSQSGGDIPPLLITSGPNLPPSFDGSRFANQRWIDNDQCSWTYGLLGEIDATDQLTLRMGAFESRSVRYRTFSDLYLNVQRDGSAQNLIVSDPRAPARWTSGEARLSWSSPSGPIQHSVHASLRARDKLLEFGGSGEALLGPVTVGIFTPRDEPQFVFGTMTTNHVSQQSLGLAYVGRWSALEWNLGVQKAHYSSSVQRGVSSDRTLAEPWLYNATLAYAPADWLGFYGGITRGLEESAQPPVSAINRDDAVPASRTRQYDFGTRLVFGTLRLVAGAFQIERPYYSIGPGNLYRPLGELRNRGLEFSLTGSLTDRLTVVGGLVLMDPQVVGEASASGRVGRRPVASTTRSLRLDMEYAIPAVDGLSLTASMQHSGAITASSGNYVDLGNDQLQVPSATLFDLGSRYAFEVAGKPVTARFQLLNLFDTHRPNVVSSNVFQLSETRRLSLQIAADF